MREIVKKVAEEISQGKNIPHYAFIIAAVLVPLLNLLKVSFFKNADLLSTVTLAILGMLLAKVLALGWRLERLEPKPLEDYVQVVSRWTSGEIASALSLARHSVVLVQSWFPDAATLADSIRECAASRRSEHPLEVEVFMLDPNLPYGEQRYIEVYQDTEEPAQKYRSEYERSKGHFVRRLGDEKSIKLTIYAYPTLPSLKAYVIDGEDYFFGWLGADGPSTRNIGFRMTSGSDLPGVRDAVKKLDSHINELRRKARVVWPRELS